MSVKTLTRIATNLKCSIKNPAAEYMLADNKKLDKPPSISVIEGNKKTLDYFIGRGGMVNKMKDGAAYAIRIEEKGSNAHSIILVKSQILKKGWSIFDPNGKSDLPFEIIDNGNNVTTDYLEVTGEDALNVGSNTYNPGYCGIFGITFLTYFKANYRDPDWVNNWNKIYECLAERLEEPKGRGTKGVDLAAEVQTIINSNGEGNPKIKQPILDIIEKYSNCDETVPSKRMRISGGRKTIKKKRKSLYLWTFTPLKI